MPTSLRFGVLLIFIIFPLLEIAVLIWSSEVIGFWPTFLILVGAAILGFAIIREQGMSVVGRMVGAVNQGRLPLEPMLDTYVLTTAGFLLVMPGLISDAIGLLLFIPPVRHLAIRWTLGEFAAGSQAREAPETPRDQRGARKSSRPIVIDGTYERIDDEDGNNPRKS